MQSLHHVRQMSDVSYCTEAGILSAVAGTRT